MRSFNWRIVLGVFLVLFGVLAVLQQAFGIQFRGSLWGIGFGVMFGLIGASFLYALWTDRARNWWAVIPGMSLIGLALLMLLTMIFPGFPGTVAAGIFLGCIGLSFVYIYWINHQNWWAVIPAGAILSVTLLVLTADMIPTFAPGLLFLGLSATFALLAFIPAEGGKKMDWPWIPAGVLFVLAVLVMTFAGPLPGFVWPILLILAGLAVLGRTFLPKK